MFNQFINFIHLKKNNQQLSFVLCALSCSKNSVKIIEYLKQCKTAVKNYKLIFTKICLDLYLILICTTNI